MFPPPFGIDEPALREAIARRVAGEFGEASRNPASSAEFALRMGDVTSVSMDQGWAFGPPPSARPRGWRPVGLAAGVLVATGVAAVVGFVAFVNVVGQEDAIAPEPVRTDAVVSDAAPPAVAVAPPDITDVRLTSSIDAETGEPGSATSVFAIGEPVQLWLSFEAADEAVPLTATWFRGDKKVGRLTAPLPETVSQMVFPLPQLAADRPGLYRVEVRARGDVLAAETFEVTHG